MKPFLRWAGSKTQLVPAIGRFWNSSFSRYVEPFCGSARVFFSLQPTAALLSDLNDELICTLAQVQTCPDTIVECLSRLPIDEKSYYAVRALDPATLSPNEKAARFIFLNSLCFNGLYRTNKNGRFNVPFGAKTRKMPFDPFAIREAAYLLGKATLENSDFEAVVDQTIKGDFLYLDPPYATSSARIFHEYGKDIFTEIDLIRLTTSLTKAASRGVKFVLSYADVPEVRELSNSWRSEFVSAKRNIAGFAGARKTAQEVLITNCEA